LQPDCKGWYLLEDCCLFCGHNSNAPRDSASLTCTSTFRPEDGVITFGSMRAVVNNAVLRHAIFRLTDFSLHATHAAHASHANLVGAPTQLDLDHDRLVATLIIIAIRSSSFSTPTDAGLPGKVATDVGVWDCLVGKMKFLILQVTGRHPVLKYRVPHGSQPRPGWAPDPLMVGIRSPDGLVVGISPATQEFWVRFPNERNQGKQGATLC
jgi:hypothetical protein